MELETEWTVTYDEVLEYLKGAYIRMIANLKYVLFYLTYINFRFMQLGIFFVPVTISNDILGVTGTD